MKGLTGAVRKGNNGRPGWGFTFTFDQEQIEALKRAVPYLHRSYNDQSHEWWVAQEYEDTVLALWPEFEAYQRQLSLFEVQ